MDASVVLVGGGPRAIAVAARLVADHPVLAPDVELTVHVVDAVEVGAGRAWRTDQDRLLLNNTYCAETTVFADETVPTAGPTRTGPTLAEWAAMITGDADGRTGGAELPPGTAPWVLEEARTIRPASFPTRAFQGVYFRWAFDRVVREAPPGLRFRPRRGRVVALHEHDGRQQVVLADGERIEADVVVLAQGLLTGAGDTETARLATAAEELGLVHVPPGLAAEQDWDVVPAGRPVLVRGLGANFFDVVGLLTTGRGGRFARRGDGELVYLASGREPQLVAGSRHALPYRAKAWFADALPRPVELPRLSASWERSVLAEHAGREDLDAAETLAALRADLADVHAAARAADPTGPAPPGPGTTGRFDLDAAAHPATAHGPFADEDDWQAFVDDYVAAELDRIRRPEQNADKIAHRAVDTARRRISRLVLARVFEPASVITVLRDVFWPRALALASGPPPERFEQLVALRRAGLVELLGPGLRIDVEDERFVARTAVPGQRRTAHALVDARVSLGDLRRTDDPLVRSQLADGQARFHAVRGPDGGVIETATLDVTTDEFLLIDAAGRPHPRRVVLGSPAGDIQWYAAIGAIAHTADKMLVGAERAAAHALRTVARDQRLRRH
ncbi:hypothetical protein FHX74_000608 [Friedmanniella endophytica]|uniref:FAD-dependent urate hydroxylase HpyO/Asp monooxygenase CreE-like FAD/NAD(P)-binding domain-containing protein n=1 Tax=Microlunatus kandeliicorticis TaxID=1759536 RepID=A0A7W3IPU7_9ACTN|nr:FAD/NAD(P)-binding protein [Microlunatus kandeliicorticis]MBA8793014.1 hypothetical protein [Microlunatus kandeliicorticis]